MYAPTIGACAYILTIAQAEKGIRTGLIRLLHDYVWVLWIAVFCRNLRYSVVTIKITIVTRFAKRACLRQFAAFQEKNFMIRVLFVCHGRTRTFAWNGLKSRPLGNENGICTPIVPLFWYFTDLLTGLPSIKMNMICGERSSFGDFFSFA